MSELTLTLLRLGFLAGLWLLVLSVVAVLRRTSTALGHPRATPAPVARHPLRLPCAASEAPTTPSALLSRTH